MATCNAMHIAEAIELHHEFGMDMLRERFREVALRKACRRPKAFWAPTSLKTLFSIEYSRTPIVLRSVSCATLEKRDEVDCTAVFVYLWQLTPKYAQHDKEEFGLALQKLVDFDVDLPPFTLLKADLWVMLFRKMRFLYIPMSSAHQELVLRLMRAGLAEAKVLTNIRSKWWNIVSIPFHGGAVIIAMNTRTSLGLFSEAVKTLKAVSSGYDTHLAREALKAAEDLLRDLQSNKIGEVDAVDHILESFDTGWISNGPVEPDFVLLPGFDFSSEDDGSWMEVFLKMDMNQCNA